MVIALHARDFYYLPLISPVLGHQALATWCRRLGLFLAGPSPLDARHARGASNRVDEYWQDPDLDRSMTLDASYVQHLPNGAIKRVTCRLGTEPTVETLRPGAPGACRSIVTSTAQPAPGEAADQQLPAVVYRSLEPNERIEATDEWWDPILARWRPCRRSAGYRAIRPKLFRRRFSGEAVFNADICRAAAGDPAAMAVEFLAELGLEIVA